MRKVVFRSFQSPGDLVMLTAAARDLHIAYPNQFITDVRTSADSLWENNPFISTLRSEDPGVETLDMHYPLIHQSNQRPYHFLHGYTQYLESKLGLRIPVTKFSGDIHLSPEEKNSPPLEGVELPERFWIVIAGGKRDFTAKWWNPASYQQVVDHFQGQIAFVQCGEGGHWHPSLTGVINLVGKTTLRQFVRLMHYAEGVICPVTFAMHLAAAVETRPGQPRHRPCVVIAGGREPPHWEAYPHHQFLSTVGMLSCCADGGCWKSRCQLVGDGDEKDHRNVCEQPVQVTPQLRIPRCQEMTTAGDVIRCVEKYLHGGLLRPQSNVISTEKIVMNSPAPRAAAGLHVERSTSRRPSAYIPAGQQSVTTQQRQTVLIEFRHGLGDAIQLTAVLRHLRQAHPEWEIDVAAQRGKHSTYNGLCRHALVLSEDQYRRNDYQKRFTLDWHECRTSERTWPSTKTSRCLQEVFHLVPNPNLCRYEIKPRNEVRLDAMRYLQSICGQPEKSGRYRAVLIHYEGNTSTDRKNLSHEVAQKVCETVLAAGYVPIIFDWDHRSPLPDGRRIHCPDRDNSLWKGRQTGDAATIAALISLASLMIGIDSGPLHVAGATQTPTIGVWTRHHPIHYFDLADNVLHLVPSDHEQLAAGPEAVKYFAENYRSLVYQSLERDLPATIESHLPKRSVPAALVSEPASPMTQPVLRATGYTAAYYEEHCRAGLDYLGFGDWQRQYGRWLSDVLGWGGQQVLDVGCACGSIARGFKEAGVLIHGVDLCEPMIQKGRDKWPDMAASLSVCDAVNLHLFTDATWHGLHSAQAAEHWKPELVPFILRELARVTRPGGFFFCALDTVELFARQNRSMETEDPTHICIKTLPWWHERLSEAGWQVCTADYAEKLRSHPQSFLSRYDWDWFVARKISS